MAVPGGMLLSSAASTSAVIKATVLLWRMLLEECIAMGDGVWRTVMGATRKTPLDGTNAEVVATSSERAAIVALVKCIFLVVGQRFTGTRLDL